MMKRNGIAILLAGGMVVALLAAFAVKPAEPQEDPGLCVTAQEQRLYKLIMEYRKQKKLPTIKLSAALTKVAQTHARDLSINKPYEGKDCNFHSWSTQGNWTSCCYDSKHSQASCMWTKPKEIAGFNTDGFEIVHGSSDTLFVATADVALAGWKKSKNHHDVIVNKEIWKDRKWSAVGIGIYKNFACVWFASTEDKNTVINKCE